MRTGFEARGDPSLLGFFASFRAEENTEFAPLGLLAERPGAIEL